MKQLYLHNLRSPARPGQQNFDEPDVRRYELPLADLGDLDAGKPLHMGGDGLDYTSLYVGMDLPRINYEDYNGKPYRCVDFFFIIILQLFRDSNIRACFPQLFAFPRNDSI